jgi:hypothetical protein
MPANGKLSIINFGFFVEAFRHQVKLLGSSSSRIHVDQALNLPDSKYQLQPTRPMPLQLLYREIPSLPSRMFFRLL